MQVGTQALGDGVGAFNARSEVVLFTDPLSERPDRYRTRGDSIEIMVGSRTLHGARYGTLIAEGAARRRDVLLMELAVTGEPTRTSTLSRTE